MKEHIRLIERLHPDSDTLSIQEKYKILDSVLAETKRLRIVTAIVVFIGTAVVAGLVFAALQIPLEEPFSHAVKGIIAYTLVSLNYKVSKKAILGRYISKKYAQV